MTPFYSIALWMVLTNLHGQETSTLIAQVITWDVCQQISTILNHAAEINGTNKVERYYCEREEAP